MASVSPMKAGADRPMRIVLFGNAPEKIAAIRYRVIKFADMLEAEGHYCTVCLPASVGYRQRMVEEGSAFTKLVYQITVGLRRLGQLRHVPGADVVFFRGPMMDYGPPVFERICRLLNPRMVFDIDDAIWEKPAYVDSFFIRLMDFGWVRKMCGMCCHAVVGNRYLAEYVQPMLPEVTIIPTCIDMDKHVAKEAYHHGGPVVLGWTGLKDNLGYLDSIAPIIQDLAQHYELKLSIATGKEYTLEGVVVENHYWQMEHEIDYLREADIGLMPLEDTPRARGKCAFKALQYMGVGVPPVLSPVGLNAEVVEEGVHGYLPRDLDAWRTALEALIQDAALREKMGKVARQRVIEHYAHEVNYPKFRVAMLKVAGRDEHEGSTE